MTTRLQAPFQSTKENPRLTPRPPQQFDAGLGRFHNMNSSLSTSAEERTRVSPELMGSVDRLRVYQPNQRVNIQQVEVPKAEKTTVTKTTTVVEE